MNPTSARTLKARQGQSMGRRRPAVTLRNTSKPSATARGYGADWRRLRASHLNRSPLCVPCYRAGLTVAAQVVDHHKTFRRPDGSIDDGLRLNPENLVSMCKPCHDRKTAATEGPNAEAVAAKGATVDGSPRDQGHPWA